MLKCTLDLSLSSQETCFLWEPRQAGKSTLLKMLFPESLYYDLLLSSQYRRFMADPSILRQECEARGLNGSNQQHPIIIDEVQKIPELLDEVHRMIENRGLRFILCGSSMRKVRLIRAPRFVFFDVGIVANLTRRTGVRAGSELFGKAFEHFITLEVFAHSSYSGRHYPVTYWRTASQLEVDLILDEKTAVEIKSTERVTDKHLKGLRAFKSEHIGDCILVSRDPEPRKTSDNILILPWREFLNRLWADKII